MLSGRIERYELCGCLLLIVGVLAWSSPGMAQTKQAAARKAAQGAGHAVQEAVIAEEEPAQRDDKGNVIQATPAEKGVEKEADVHNISPKSRAQKALADGHKAPKIIKPGPNFLGAGLPMVKGHESAAKAHAPEIESRTRTTPQPPEVGVNFLAITDDGSIPPDVAMSAGPNQIVTAANLILNVFDKLGNLLSSRFLAGGSGNLYKKLGAFTGPNWKIFDPVVHYDPYIKRFWLTVSDVNNSKNAAVVIIALSNSEDASGSWSLFVTDFTLDGSSQTSNYCDYPQLGFDTQAIYISCNMRSLPAGANDSHQYGKVRVMAKQQFLTGPCCSWFDQWNLPRTVQPAIMRRAKNSDGEYLTDAADDQGSDSQLGSSDSGDTLDVWHFPDPIGNPSEMDQTTVSVSGYYTPPSAPQPNPNGLIDTGDARLLFAVWQEGKLSTGQTTLCNSAGGTYAACAAFYEMDVSGFPNVTVVNDWALQEEDVAFYYPALDENNNSDKIMVYTLSADGQGGGTGPVPLYVGIPNSHTCTNCAVGAPQGAGGLAPAGGGSSYVNFAGAKRNRWGDYQSAAADPDGVGVWVAGEYATGLKTWDVQVEALYNIYRGKLKVSPTSVNFSDTKSSSTWDRDITLSNIGNADLTIQSVNLTGSNDFRVTFNNCKEGAVAPPGVLEPKQSCVVKVGFKPKGGGEKKATLNICSSAVTPCLVPATAEFTFDGPVIDKVKPNNGPLVGGAVTVSGDGLSDKFKYEFGAGNAATDVSCPTARTCTMTAPAHAAGHVDVIAKGSLVSSSANPSDRFTYQAPEIDKISPQIGPTTGGQGVQLTGVGFYPLMIVKFGDTIATQTIAGHTTDTVDCTSDVSCEVISPAGTGSVQVTATLSGVTSPIFLTDLYTYAIFPSMSSVTPDSGPVTGGISVTITGTNFSTAPGGTIFKFGSLDPTGVTCSSSTQCTVTAPVRSGSASFLEVPVTATVSGNTSIDGVAFRFGTAPPPPPKPPCKGTGCH